MEKAGLETRGRTAAQPPQLQRAGNAAAVQALRADVTGASADSLAPSVRASIERDAATLARSASASHPDRFTIVNTFDDWDNKDRAVGGSSSAHVDALCAALESIRLTEVTTGLDAVWYAVRSSAYAPSFEAALRRSARYRDHQPGPPLRGALAYDQRRADDIRLLVLAGDHEQASRRLRDVWPATSRDDVALELVKYLTSAQLVAMTSTPRGRLFSAQLYDELTSGQAGADEEAQAQRLLAARAAAPGTVERFDRASRATAGMTFPFRKGGITAQSALPFAHVTASGKIHVKIAANVRFADVFRQDWETLPISVFTSGLDLDPDEFVRVRMYDEGGVVEVVPALRLVALSNLGVTHTMGKIAEVAGYGLGGVGGVGTKAGLLAKTLLWADRIALVGGAVTSVLAEHRGEIIARWGPAGREFAEAVDTVNSAIAMFGVARVAIELPALAVRLGAGVVRLRRARDAAAVTAQEAAVVDAVLAPADDLRAQLERLGREARAANDDVERVARSGGATPEVRASREPLPGLAANDDVEVLPPPASRALEEVLEDQPRLAAGAEGQGPVPAARKAQPHLVEASGGTGGGTGRGTGGGGRSTGKVAPPASGGGSVLGAGSRTGGGSKGGGGSRRGPASSPHARVSSKPGTDGKRGWWSESMHRLAAKLWDDFVPEKYWIDMTEAPASSPRTAQGWQRNPDWFWRKFHERFRNEAWMSPDNLKRAAAGEPCHVDDLWIQKFPEFRRYRGDVMRHHHVERGPYAAPLPSTYHSTAHWLLHYIDPFD